MACVSMQLATTITEDRLVPIREPEVKKGHGAWTPVHIFIDRIAIEAGFSNNSYQAQSVSLELCGATWRFVHATDQSPWFIAAAGGPNSERVICPQ